MKLGTRLSISPATAIALVALFFALGGSAFAVEERFQAPSATQKRCSNGAVRGIAVVTGDPRVGIANLPDRFTAGAAVFSRRFNCTGRGVQVRRTGRGVYEIRFPGLIAPSAVATGLGAAQTSVELAPDGVFRVSVYPAGIHDAEDRGFTIVVV
ncbi:MAG TPA: hypothetical protein VMN35_00995 [Gaiellaceae bacterium]|nr:hypothetical protein [Gaiellaceae bacterium]